MLRKYNPKLRGYSLGTGDYNSSGSNFNIAQPGHTSYHMLGQAKLLVKRIKADSKVNFTNDWKLITFFVGGNDLCKYCKDKDKYQPLNYLNNIQATLDFLQTKLPRTLVNLVLTLDVTGIQYMSGTFACRTMQNILCECGINQANAAEQNVLVTGYQTLTTDLINSGRYDTKDDFTVVLQPFMSEMKPPLLANGSPDYSYFAPDCFHFSLKGHETIALELWNNMFQPVGQKDNVWTAYVNSVKCPTESKPFIYTRRNSD
jgi:phospholipase B1, membrane-associated